MTNNNLSRIGVFYDGSYFTYAQFHYNTLPEKGWIIFEPLHELIEQIVAEKEQGFNSYKVVYSSWFQGLKHTQQSEQKHLEIERNRHIDLIDAGVELKFTHDNHEQTEKGVDVTMALEVLQVALDDKIDVAVLITGDGDFIPLVRSAFVPLDIINFQPIAKPCSLAVMPSDIIHIINSFAEQTGFL